MHRLAWCRDEQGKTVDWTFEALQERTAVWNCIQAGQVSHATPRHLAGIIQHSRLEGHNLRLVSLF